MKIEMHSHTNHSSRCGKVEPETAMKMFADAGYDVVVCTDHFNTYNLNFFEGTPLEKAQQWLHGYELAKAAGEKFGVNVLFGLEARIPGSDNDYLIYGAEPNFVLENPQLNELDQVSLHNLCHKYGALLIQAHPNRPMCFPASYLCLDGIEVSNGNPRQKNNNEKSLYQAEKNPALIRVSGSDFHQIPDMDRGGILTDCDIRDNRDLVECLKSGKYELITIDL